MNVFKKLKEWFYGDDEFHFWRFLCFVCLWIFAFQGLFIYRFVGSPSDAWRFFKIMRIVRATYNGNIDNKQVYDGAIKGMVEGFGDPYTTYLDEKHFQQLSEMTVGSFGGVGMVFGKRGDNYVVISPMENTPASRAGVKSGDIIVAVDGESTAKMNMEEVGNKIRGKIDTEVKILFKRGNDDMREVTLKREEIKTPSVGGSMLEGTQIGYIRISMFSETTVEDFDKKLAELQGKDMKALVLDLRGNPGGTLNAGTGVASRLVPKGTIVSIIDKNGNKQVIENNMDKITVPLAVLVDHGSASASEIVSGAIKDTHSGKLFGEKTYGKGSVQSVFQLTDDTAVKVTTAKYYTPSGVSIHNVGIEPDVEVKLPDDLSSDTQLQAAKEYLLGELGK